ncbi:MAG: chemotaxis protein CheW [Wenzhouxiangellaceae bacterium]
MATKATTLFGLLADYERRAMAHDVSDSSQRDRENTWDGVVFRLGPHRLTVGIDEVDEILPYPVSTPVPGAADWLIGLANVRGNLVTVVDLGWFLYGSRTPVTARTRLILTRLQGRHLGLIVDEVYGQRHFSRDATAETTIDDESLQGRLGETFVHGDEQWTRLKLDALLRDPEFLDGSARSRPAA